VKSVRIKLLVFPSNFGRDYSKDPQNLAGSCILATKFYSLVY